MYIFMCDLQRSYYTTIFTIVKKHKCMSMRVGNERGIPACYFSVRTYLCIYLCLR